MADRLNYYFRQGVTEAELDLGFELLEQADRNLAGDIGIFGIIDGMRASERDGVPDLSVDLTAPGRAYDRLGRRIFYGTAQNVDLSTDVNGVATAVQGEGNEKIVSLYIQFDRLPSDPRTDGNSQQVFFRLDESFRFVVRQGSEAPAGQAVPPPLQPDALLIVDVARRFGQSQILNSDLRPNPLVPDDEGRRQRFVFAEASAIGVFTGGFRVLDPIRDEVQAVLQEIDASLEAHYGGTEGRHAAEDIDVAAMDGNPFALPAGTVRSQVAALLAHLNDHKNAVSSAHPAAAVTYSAGGSWADNSPNPAGTVQGQLDKIVSDLSGAGGAAKLGASAVSGSPHALDTGTVQGQISALLAHLNAHANATGDAHLAAAIRYAAGPAWLGGRANPAATAQAQLDKIVSDLGVQAEADDGAGRIGAAPTAGTPRSLQAGSVRSQVDALLDFINAAGALELANSWAAKQSFLGASSTEPALAVDTAASTRRLALELRGNDFLMRLYYAARNLEAHAERALERQHVGARKPVPVGGAARHRAQRAALPAGRNDHCLAVYRCRLVRRQCEGARARCRRARLWRAGHEWPRARSLRRPFDRLLGNAGRVGFHEQQHRRRRLVRVGSPAGGAELGDLHREGGEQHR